MALRSNVMTLEAIQQVALAAAHEAGRTICSLFGKVNARPKGNPIDLVTEADIAAEGIVLKTISAAYPDHAILAEESGRSGPARSEDCWVVDPLDGTTNFAHGLPLVAVSIAFCRRDRPVVGVVLNPILGELFLAVAGQGATRNGKPIRVTSRSAVGDSLLVTGFPYNHKTCASPLLERFARCLGAARGVRRLGSAALDLCYVACGRFDGFWEQNLQPWDTAAGVVIAQEAGARVTDFSDDPFAFDQKEVLVTNGQIHSEMLSLLDLKKERQ
jgi:myo-inositol-1(or 4)-monophosphatase